MTNASEGWPRLRKEVQSRTQATARAAWCRSWVVGMALAFAGCGGGDGRPALRRSGSEAERATADRCWGETQLSGPFDLDLAPDMRGNAHGYLLGDYQSLLPTANPGDFPPVCTQTDAGDRSDLTDIYALRARTDRNLRALLAARGVVRPDATTQP